MRVRLSVLTLTLGCFLGALVPTSALAAPVSTATRASAADVAYGYQVLPVLKLMGKAKAMCLDAATALGKNDDSTAVSKFAAALVLFKKAQARLYALQPPRDMGQANTYLRAAADDYVQAATYFRDGSSPYSGSSLRKGLAFYKRATSELKQAYAALTAHF